MKPLFAALLIALALPGCKEERTAAVPPVTMTAEAVGRYCGMTLTEHAGPKGQVILTAGHDPFWFSSARDALSFTMMPDEPKDYAAIYVSDMARAADWAEPGPDNWVDATAAFYVVGSDARAGMGGVEIVPFSDRSAAEDFARQHGGAVRAFAELTPAEVLGEGSAPEDAAPQATAPGQRDPAANAAPGQDHQVPHAQH